MILQKYNFLLETRHKKEENVQLNSKLSVNHNKIIKKPGLRHVFFKKIPVNWIYW